MKAAVSHDNTERTIRIKVADGPVLDVSEPWHTKPRRIKVDAVTIRVIDGETRYIKAMGGLMLKSGQPSDLSRAERGWGTHRHEIGTAPEWVRTLWREAPAGVTEWIITVSPEQEA